MTKTAVVILNYNGENYLRQFLPSVINYSGDAEIIVADNQSTDKSVTLLEQEFPTVSLIKLDKNNGFAGGYNRALAQVDAELLVLLNSDVQVTEGWLNPLIAFMDQHPTYAACQPKVKDYHHRNRFEYAGAGGGYIDRLGYPYCRGRIFDSIEEDNGQYDTEADIFWATGACLMIRNSIFREAKGLDEDFFAHMEEIDLCWRVQSLGYQIRAIPASEVFHVGGGTLSKLNSFKTYLNFRNGIFMLIKNLPLRELLLKLPVRLVLDWVAALKFILEGNWKHGLAVIRAHWKVVLSLGSMWKKRQQLSNTPSRLMIVLKYYLFHKRRFDQL